MDPLLRRAFFLFVYTYACFADRLDLRNDRKKRQVITRQNAQRKLTDSKERINLKYNMSDGDFEGLVTEATGAVLEHEELDYAFWLT